MKHLLFAVKRLFVSFRFPLFLLLLLILPLLAQRAAGEVAVPAPVYAIEGQADADATRMAACLEAENEKRRTVCLSLVEPLFIVIAGGFILMLLMTFFMPLINDIGWI